LRKAGFDVVLLETRHVKAALSAMIVKTGRRDAHGIAQLLRMATEVPVVGKSVKIREEVVVRQERTSRVATVRDTVRRDKIEVTRSTRSDVPSYPVRNRTLASDAPELDHVASRQRSMNGYSLDGDLVPPATSVA
jgi:hypothetical protein